MLLNFFHREQLLQSDKSTILILTDPALFSDGNHSILCLTQSEYLTVAVCFSFKRTLLKLNVGSHFWVGIGGFTTEGCCRWFSSMFAVCCCLQEPQEATEIWEKLSSMLWPHPYIAIIHKPRLCACCHILISTWSVRTKKKLLCPHEATAACFQ